MEIELVISGPDEKQVAETINNHKQSFLFLKNFNM